MHRTPRTGALNEEPPDILIPAMGKLRECGTGFDTLMLIEAVPDALLPALAWFASRKRDMPRAAVTALVKACGFAHLERGLGRTRTRELMAAFGEHRAAH
ncbi:MAG: hypothetical protein Q7V17_13825 [Afipia sp.]|nr:hypothetical protein [Afipia sp.]